MKSGMNILYIAVIALVFFGMSCTGSKKTDRELVWSDEFDYTGLPDK